VLSACCGSRSVSSRGRSTAAAPPRKFWQEEGIVVVYVESHASPGRELVEQARTALSADEMARATETGRRLTVADALDLARIGAAERVLPLGAQNSHRNGTRAAHSDTSPQPTGRRTSLPAMTNPFMKGDGLPSPMIPNGRHTGSTPGMVTIPVTFHMRPSMPRTQFPTFKGRMCGCHAQLEAPLPAAGTCAASGGIA
jgi:hypothetical protein